jgi:hypothetical protein
MQCVSPLGAVHYLPSARGPGLIPALADHAPGILRLLATIIPCPKSATEGTSLRVLPRRRELYFTAAPRVASKDSSQRETVQVTRQLFGGGFFLPHPRMV